MSRFTVFDVETPNRICDRMSSIGITVVEDGEIVREYTTLINPETYFDSFCMQLTGINPGRVKNAPSFPQAWEEIRPLMESGLTVAHNAVFDLGVLKKCLRAYGIEWKPYIRYLCTVKMGRKLLPGMKHSLDCMCGYYGIDLDHHKADSDSRACAELLLHYLDEGADIREFIRTYSFTK